MLIRLLPEQVSKAWDVIAPAIAETLPPMLSKSHTAIVNVLEAVMAERANVWIYYKEDRPACVVLTTVQRDPIMHSISLLIYSMYALEDLKAEDWEHGISRLKVYAEFIGADKVITYASNPGVVRMLDRLGADTSFTLIEV